ncbi:MAG: hypothetical protein FLDDKLPJ_02007 [Phycisphaerae bacterium]|nr:hypothetical protein [Phycisphaerae bacterium]
MDVEAPSNRSGSVNPLLKEFLAWVADRPRTYGETMQAWKSSCPRMTVWEDAVATGLIRVDRVGRLESAAVSLTPLGHATLQS